MGMGGKSILLPICSMWMHGGSTSVRSTSTNYSTYIRSRNYIQSYIDCESWGHIFANGKHNIYIYIHMMREEPAD